LLLGCRKYVKKSEIDNFQEKLLKEGKAPATDDHVISKTRAMVNKAIGDDLISRDAVKAFKVKNTLKKGSDVRDRILSPVEFQSLMENAAEHLRPIVACGYHTGMRKGEILGLTWDKVDLANRMIHLEAKDTKDTEARNIPICDELHQHLVPMPNRVQGTGQDSHVFQYNGKPVKNIAKALKKACEKAKIKYGRFVKDGFVFYDLRHTFNTYMRKAGVQESVIMSITGHSTREMFDRYNAVDEDDKQEAMEQLGYFLTKDSPEVAKQIDDFLTKNPKEAAKHIKEFLAKGPKKAVKSLRVYLANVTQMVTQIKNTEKKTSRKVPTDNNS
jgi:integrase